MATDLPPAEPQGLRRIFAWRRMRIVLAIGFGLSLLLVLGWRASYAVLLARLLLTGFGLLLVFGLFERWPRRLPRWLARWTLQVVAVAVFSPPLVMGVYTLTTLDYPEPWYLDTEGRVQGFIMITFLSLLIAPWVAITALMGQIRGQAERQALAFELERSQFARREADARLQRLQAQVEPHFLFNTLANVRELVDSGSPQASQVLGSLIAYLRAAVPRLHQHTSTLGQELDLVRAYLEVMHMRMPDRLQYALHVDAALLARPCPPMALLTLVENAVRHGIDPGEEGGRIDVHVRERAGVVQVQVSDTGVGLQASHGGLGTGLANLRERLQLAYGDRARLAVSPARPRGVDATLEYPVEDPPA
ncbi:sensor histidine kinase [Arenimonas sp. MALMAid1274]|uniref:sensor histidine kinase n=1 Tax=Arenimonas sp. MALMAid1274 TaxID=3411630 RepID=UPI003B9E4154